jgi:hypothetical protein
MHRITHWQYIIIIIYYYSIHYNMAYYTFSNYAAPRKTQCLCAGILGDSHMA